MMVFGPSQFVNDGETLQADVMRFMAIIGFCLVAILALVRNVEPVTAPSPPEKLKAEIEKADIAKVDIAKADIVKADAEKPDIEIDVTMTTPVDEPTPLSNWRDPIEKPQPLPVVRATPRPIEKLVRSPTPEMLPPVEKETKAPSRSFAEPPAIDTPPRADDVPAVAASETSEEEGLTLRFASDGDFLRLIAKGGIKVYAYRQSDVLSLNDSYRFLESRAPGQVYELLRESIPSLIVDALRRERSEIGTFTWGIALPNRISGQIDQHLKSVKNGQLIINRYGDVRHAAS